MSNENQRQEALFEALGKSKKRRRRKILLTVTAIILVAAIALLALVGNLRRRVQEKFAFTEDEILSYQAATGTLHTVVNGSGTIDYVDDSTQNILFHVGNSLIPAAEAWITDINHKERTIRMALPEGLLDL